MPQEFLNDTDVVPCLQQMRSETVGLMPSLELFRVMCKIRSPVPYWRAGLILRAGNDHLFSSVSVLIVFSSARTFSRIEERLRTIAALRSHSACLATG